MSLKAFAVSSLFALSPISSSANEEPSDRLCISQESGRVIEGQKVYVSGILSCVGEEPIPDFSPDECTKNILKPSEFMLAQLYTSCPYNNAVLQQ